VDPAPVTRRPSSGLFFPEIDGMRALAAFNVLVCHAILGTHWYPRWLVALQDGAIGVEFFFVLSGFLLFLPFATAHRTAEKMPGIRNYAIRRMLRILPAYYVCLGLTLLFRYPEAFATAAGWRAILAHLTMTFTFSAKTIKIFNPVFWTLAVEEQFYFALPILAIIFCRRFGRLLLLASLVVSHFIVLLVSKFFPAYDYLLTATLPFRWDGFAFGIFVCMTYLDARDRRENFGWRQRVAVPLAVGGLLVPFFATWFQARWRFAGGDYWAIVVEAFGFALLLWATLLGPRWIGAPWRWKPLRALGLLTYSMYLWHWQVSEQVRLLTQPPWGPKTTASRIALVFVFTLVVAIGSYFLVEKPFMAMRRRLKERPRVSGAPAAETVPAGV
jgi:peptidoglycan/LPS O-acetylase OafA/YrhL